MAVLASTDAVFEPFRFRGKKSAGVYLARKEFRSRGVPWHGGSGAAGRKAAERALDEAVAKRLVVAHSAGIRRTGVRLTDAGEIRARDLCGLPDYTAAAKMVARLAQFQRDGYTIDNTPRGLVPETLLADRNYPAREGDFLQVEESLLPTLSRGMVRAEADIHGRVYYAIEDTAAALPPLPPEADRSRSSDKANDLYTDTIGRERDRLQMPVEGSELGRMPLPVGGWCVNCKILEHPLYSGAQQSCASIDRED